MLLKLKLPLEKIIVLINGVNQNLYRLVVHLAPFLLWRSLDQIISDFDDWTFC